MTPQRGWHCSLLLIPAAPSSRSQTLEGLFELTQHPSRALNLASCLSSATSETHRQSQVWRTWRAQTLTKNPLFYTDPWLLKANIIELSKWSDQRLTRIGLGERLAVSIKKPISNHSLGSGFLFLLPSNEMWYDHEIVQPNQKCHDECNESCWP